MTARARDLCVALGLALALFGAGDGLEARHADDSVDEPAPSRRMVPDAGGAFRELVLHFDPLAEAEVAPTHRDLLRAVDPAATIWVAVAERAHFDRFRALCAAWSVPRPERLRPVVVGRPITAWPRDRYVLLARPGGRVLLVPPRPHEGAPARRNDYLSPFALARQAGPGVTVERAPLVFDGGDLLASRRHVFVTATLLGRNEGGSLSEPAELRRYLRRALGLEVVLLGRDPEDVPPHHVGMLLAALDDGTMLVGDPEAGLALLPAGARLPLPVERRPEELRRFARVAEELRAAGFRVERVPMVPLANLAYVTYTNGLIERRADGKLHAYIPQFGLTALDAAGRTAYQRHGMVVHPVDVSRVFHLGGTLHCLANVLRVDLQR